MFQHAQPQSGGMLCHPTAPSLEAGRLTFSDALSSAGSSEDRSRHMGMRGSHGISIRALPKGSSLTRPTTVPRFLEGCSIATTLAHARSSGR